MLKIISFDFDATLIREDVQIIAADLITKGHDVWIITSRHDELQLKYIETKWKNYKPNNNSLYQVLDKLNIPRWKVIYTASTPKRKYLTTAVCDIHIDDNINEINLINQNTKTKGICITDNSNWISEIL